jgi:predicted nucleotidyltransferase component of viral defense system
MVSSTDRLTGLQRALLEAFFRRERRFFLTGGAALAGFYLHHRTTLDLELFTLDPEAFQAGRRVLETVVAELGATLEVRQHAPGFERVIVMGNGESVVVDLVLERVPQTAGPKRTIGTIEVDPIEEILANKLTAILARSEERDLVDLLYLERQGFKVEEALPAALAKDGGCTPAALAWVLSEIAIPDAALLPGAVTPADLRRFVADLVVRLRQAAFPARESR